MIRRPLGIVLALLPILLAAQEPARGPLPSAGYPPPEPARDAARFGANVRRTMALLASSTPERRHPVRILFYGQSITEQSWWRDVADDLRRRFPDADLTVANRALGGFAAPILARTAEHDVYPFYPDLVVFHVYGPEPDYEALVREIRRRTTAEIAFTSDHVTWLPSGTSSDDPEALRVARWHDDHASKFLPGLAARLGCEYIDVREPWRRYLAANRLQPADLLKDVVHLNDRGCFLMAALVKPHLRFDPAPPGTPGEGLVKDAVIGKDVSWKDGRLTLEFDGNKVDAIAEDVAPSATSGSATVRIDGRSPASFRELYSSVRPTNAIGSGWPAILRVSWEATPVPEVWTARIIETNGDASKFTFAVSGSITGPDGEGDSGSRFVSRSRRVVIEPGDWWVGPTYRRSKVPMKPGFEVKWKVKPLFVESYAPPAAPDPTREVLTTLAQDLPNGRHTLELISTSGDPVPLKAIRIYRPPVR